MSRQTRDAQQLRAAGEQHFGKLGATLKASQPDMQHQCALIYAPEQICIPLRKSMGCGPAAGLLRLPPVQRLGGGAASFVAAPAWTPVGPDLVKHLLSQEVHVSQCIHKHVDGNSATPLVTMLQFTPPRTQQTRSKHCALLIYTEYGHWRSQVESVPRFGGEDSRSSGSGAGF